MVLSDKQKQKKLLKKKQKKASVSQAAKASSNNISALGCAGYPLHECVVSTELFEIGLGEVFISRQLSEGNLGVSAFMVDVFCLGVKNAFFRIMSENEYEGIKQAMADSGRYFEPIQINCAKKLLQGAVEYAKNLGFSAHTDYKKAAPLLGNSDASVCSTHFDYGRDGKPFYIRGPNESVSVANKIVKKIHAKYGDGGFDYMDMLEGEL